MILSQLLFLTIACVKPSTSTTENPVTPANVQESETSDTQSEVLVNENNSDTVLAEAAALLTSHDKTLVSRAVDMLLKLHEEKPDSVDIVYNIGVGYVALERTDEARKYFIKATEIDPTFDRAWYNLSILTEREEGYDAAIKTLRQGLKSAEDSPKLQAGIIEILRKQKQYDKAFELGKEYLKANANNLDIYNSLGLIYIEQEQYDMAKFIFRLAEKKNGGANNAKLLTSYGYLLYLTKDYQAREKLEAALKINPDLLQARLYLSTIHLDNRAFAEAVDHLEAALKNDPLNPVIHLNLGVAYRGNNQVEQAETAFKKALELNPKNVDPILNLAILESDNRNDFDKALGLVDEYLEKGGDKSEQAEAWKGEIETAKSDFEEQEKRRKRAEERRRRAEERQKRMEEEARKEAEAEKESQQDELERLKSMDEAGEDSQNSESAPSENEASETNNESGEWGSGDENTGDENTGDTSTEIEGDTESEEGSEDTNSEADSTNDDSTDEQDSSDDGGE